MTLLHIDPTLRPALKEVDKQSDRGAAIIACAIVDELLTRALQKRLILTSEVKDKLFSNERNGPLATFSNKIDLGFATGLLNSKVRSDLHNIRRVRNRFAHRLDPLEFKEAEIANWCKNLNAPREIKDPRKRASSALMITERLEIRLAHLLKDPDLAATYDAEMGLAAEALMRYAS